MQIVRNDPRAITRLFGTGLEDMDVLLTHVRRGSQYNIVCIAIRESDEVPLLIYKNAETGDRWARPVADFFSLREDGTRKWIWNRKADKIMSMIESALKSYNLGKSDRLSK